MKAVVFQEPGRLEGALFHSDGSRAAWTGPHVGSTTVQQVVDALMAAVESEGLGPVRFEFFVDPQGAHRKEFHALELRLAWEVIRGIASFPGEFKQDRLNPHLGLCNHAVSEVGPTLKAINAALTRDARLLRAVTSPFGANAFLLAWQD